MTVFFKAENAMLTDYCRYLFPQEEEGGPNVVNGRAIFGRMLIGSCRICEAQPAKPNGDNVIQLRFGESHGTQRFRDKFLFFTSGDMAALNLALKAVFDLDLNTYYQYATALGFEKKDIIDAFIVSRGLSTHDPGDALHKRIYRREQKKHQQLSALLLRKVKYINEALDTSGLKMELL